MMALLLGTVCLVALLSIDIGYLFWRQRQLQSIADLAALAAAQPLRRVDSDAALRARVAAAASASTAQNGYALPARLDCAAAGQAGAAQEPEDETQRDLENAPAGQASAAEDGAAICPGLWDPSDAANAERGYFRADYDPATAAPNAVRVTVSETVPILFALPGGRSRQLRASAIATASPPVAAFSLGSGLLDVSSANSLLGLLLGHAVNLSVLDWKGLAEARVTLNQLRLAARAGTVQELLDLDLSLTEFYGLVLRAAGRDALLSTMLAGAPARIDRGALDMGLSLGRVVDVAMGTPASASAADVGLNVAQLLLAAAQVANTGSALDLSAAIPVLPGSAVRLTLHSPPQFAVGPVGPAPNGSGGWRTTATTAQAGLALRLPVALPAGALEGAGGLTGLLGALTAGTVDAELALPLYVRVANAESSLTGLRCAAAAPDRRATLDTTTSVASACLARADLSGCAQPGEKVLLGKIGVPLLHTQIALHGLARGTEQRAESVQTTLAPGMQAEVASRGQLTRLLQRLARDLDVEADVRALGLGGTLTLPLGSLAENLGTVLATALGPALDALLRLLGISLGSGDVWVHDIDCDNIRLVY